MKQHITIDQLNELTPKQKKKLEKWWKTSLGDTYIDSHFGDRELHIGALDGLSAILAEKPFYPLLSIGQMIEFLNDHWNDWYMDYQDTTCYWSVKLGYLPNIEEPRLSYGDEELCDALFEAVKEVLKHELLRVGE